MPVRAMGWAHSFPMSGGVRAGREWTRRQLASLPWSEKEPDTVDSVVLVVSELLTNAHRHAHSDAHLVLSWDGQCLHVNVHDESRRLPDEKESGTEDLSGRGVHIVKVLADSWDARCQRHGKTVTACFQPDDPAAADGAVGPQTGPAD
ncbi:ATP-binding protein [Streptomyces minutiscleroticus]|uniref:Histidine kinase/HSP90-like ATPase domain-containing protein n=1 Tax=Streptomyces minutiscleroticus TaxID=68238 RepID=A0A918U435_9ACTN|nr:ATP-binding protein [Streptomyces minutiscleroticus]GGX89809.1 hypothetical protein GCM10010358_49710 [Streptomyces minutiscleroticus]